MADKKVFKILSVFVLVSLLSLTLVSAGWLGDIFGRITGKVIDSNQSINCSDTDGGISPYKKGTIFLGEISHTDSCVLSNSTSSIFVNSCSGNGCEVYEFSCQLDGTGLTTYLPCPNGCSNGACIVNTTIPHNSTLSNLTCTDSDGGLDYYIKGYVNVSEGIIVDSCEWRGDKYPYPVHNCSGSMCYIYEANCRDYPPTYADISYSCPNGCADGACIPEQENSTGKLKSDFFRNDKFALTILNGEPYLLKDSNLYSPDTGVGGSGYLNYNVTSFEYKILNTFRQLGYLGIFLSTTRDDQIPDTLSTTVLHRFQEDNNLSISNYLDAISLLLLDRQIYAVEQKDKSDISNYPAFSAFSKRVPFNEPSIEHIAALYYKLAKALPFDIPRSTEGQFDARMPLTIEELRHRITPPRQANFGMMLSSDGRRILSMDEAIEVYNTSSSFLFCPSLLYNGFFPEIGDCINPPSKILKNIHSMSNYDFMYLIIHEYGHEVGKAIINLNNTSEDIDNHFRKISFNARISLEGGGYSSNVTWLREDNTEEFITNYARSGTNQNEINSSPAWNAPYEDFAESFTFYLLQGKIFRLRAKENSHLQQKYDFLKNYVFKGREYHTGDIESYEDMLKDFADERGIDFLMSMSRFQSSSSRSAIWEGDYLYTLAPGFSDQPSSSDSLNLFKGDNNLQCSGCPIENSCYSYGHRKNGNFCSDETNTFILQKDEEMICENNWECSSNLCIDGKCVSSGVWQKFLEWIGRLFGGN